MSETRLEKAANPIAIAVMNRFRVSSIAARAEILPHVEAIVREAAKVAGQIDTEWNDTRAYADGRREAESDILLHFGLTPEEEEK